MWYLCFNKSMYFEKQRNNVLSNLGIKVESKVFLSLSTNSELVLFFSISSSISTISILGVGIVILGFWGEVALGGDSLGIDWEGGGIGVEDFFKTIIPFFGFGSSVKLFWGWGWLYVFL